MDKQNKSDSGNNFIVQGSILAVAGILVRLLGLAKRIPLYYIIGNVGNSYYSSAYDVYYLFFTISAYGIPVALSKLVSAKISKGEYRNADKIFKCTLKLAAFVGGLFTVVVFFFSNSLASVFKEPMSYLAVKVISFSLFFVCILSVFRGYYQGMGTMVPTAFSQLIEQIATVGVGIAGAYFLAGYGTKVGLLLHNENYKYAYGAAGAIGGCVAGAICATVFLILLYRKNQKRIQRNIYKDPTNKLDSSLSIYRSVILTIIPIVLSSSITMISNITDHILHNFFMELKGLEELKSANWGVYSGQYMVLVNVVLALATAMGAATVPTLAGHVKRKEFDIVASKVQSVIRITMLVAIPAATGLAVMAPSAIFMIFSNTDPLAPNLLRIGSIGIVLFSFSTLSSFILQGMNHLYTPIKHGLIAFAIHICLMSSLLYFTNLNTYSVAISNNVFALTMCVLNFNSIRRYLRYRQEIKKTFVLPVLCSALMGIVVWVLSNLLQKNGYSRAKIVLIVLIGILVYGLSMLFTKAIGKEEIYKFPGGRRLYGILKKFHLMQ